MSAREDSIPWIQGVLDRHETSLVSYAARLVGDLEGARDVVQDTFLRLLDRGQSLRHGPPEVLARWLYTTCRRRALDQRRRGERMRVREEKVALTTQEWTEVDAPSNLERQESMGLLRRLLTELPVSQQEAVRLRFQLDLSYREIAEITGQSIGTVGFLLHQAVRTLRQKVRAVEGSVGR